ncbi:hypothetical protein F4814DRAFT_409779 [Daldinia grandis]|nr:hypothetical protein F4814DRAFT_409779 [Daldinia grandis]
MEFRTSGLYRYTPMFGHVGATTICLMTRFGAVRKTYRDEVRDKALANQDIETLAIVVALLRALEQYEEMKIKSRVSLSIVSDSRYAITCMTELLFRWRANGWRNSYGQYIPNVALYRFAYALEARVKMLGSITYNYMPIEANTQARLACAQVLDKLQADIAIRHNKRRTLEAGPDSRPRRRGVRIIPDPKPGGRALETGPHSSSGIRAIRIIPDSKNGFTDDFEDYD